MDRRNHEYCCCAIPTMNVGIYLTLAEQFSIGLLAGILAVATSSIVGAAVPSIAKWTVAIVCFVICGLQVMGFIGVFKEKPGLFSKYARINSLAVSALLGLMATWIVVSATRHGTAKDACIQNFFSSNNSTTSTDAGSNIAAASTSGEGDIVCNIFTWVDIGIMGALWLVMLIFQGYLLLLCHWYASGQQADHSKYYSIYSVEASQAIPLRERQGEDAWDPRPSTDSWTPSGVRGSPPTGYRDAYRDHGRHDSDVTERGYGTNGEKYTDGYGPAGMAGVGSGETRQGSMQDASFSPSSSYSKTAGVEHTSPTKSYRGSMSPPPPGARVPNAEDYQQGIGYPQTAPYTQPTYTESGAPQYQTDYHQQPHYGLR